jgi:hypothetical protein
VLQVNYSYELPIGKGKLLLGNASPVANTLLGGWQLSGLVNAESGQPFNPTFDAGVSQVDYSSAPGLPGAVSGRPNRVAGAALYPTKKTINNWFNTAAFSCPLVTDPTNSKQYCSGYGNAGYDLLRGPRYQDWDISLQKNTKWEHYNVQLRVDAFNVFNHANFGLPSGDITAPGAQTITSTPSQWNPPAYEPRTIEFGAKFSF